MNKKFVRESLIAATGFVGFESIYWIWVSNYLRIFRIGNNTTVSLLEHITAIIAGIASIIAFTVFVAYCAKAIGIKINEEKI